MLKHTGQRGVVLFLALVVLVAMMLGGLALFRNVDTSILVSGNVSLQKSATRSGDAGAEAAIAWLASSPGTTLYNDTTGYVAAGLANPKGSNQTWPQYWDTLNATYSATSLVTDAAGNTVSYIIQRMCNLPGEPYAAGPPPVECIEPPTSSSSGSSMGAGFIALNRPTTVYYRITVRTEGPRHSVSFIQTTYLM